MRNPVKRILLLTTAAFAISITGCLSDPHTELGQPRPNELESRWSQLEKGMTRFQVRGLLGYPVGFKSQGGQVEWHYSFGTVTFTKASEPAFSGTDGSLISWTSGR